MTSFDPAQAARFVFDAHQARADYRNLPPEIAPPSIKDAYAAQDALAGLLEPTAGPVAGLKVATTTKVMQELMGIDHPCAGLIFARRIHQTPANIRLSDFVHVMVECELALRLRAGLPGRDEPYTAENVVEAVEAAAPAFELIEDRNAHYRSSKAASMIADNCWNAGIVVGGMQAVRDPARLIGCPGRLTVNEVQAAEGKTENPFATLAWLANVAVERRRPLQPGMVVITGSVVATLPIHSGDHMMFELAGLGAVEMRASA